VRIVDNIMLENDRYDSFIKERFFVLVRHHVIECAIVLPKRQYLFAKQFSAEQFNAYKALIHATDLQGDWLKDIAFWRWDMIGAQSMLDEALSATATK